MAHGTLDWGERSPKIITYALGDMAELAVRLGSGVNYDRRGEVIWYEGFDQGGQGYTSVGTGTGNEVYLSCNGVAHGGLCLVLKTGNVNGNFSSIYKIWRYPVLGNIGFEISFAPDSNIAVMNLYIDLYDGVYVREYRVYYNHGVGYIYLVDQALGLVTVGNCGIVRDNAYTYSQFKLIVNCETGNFVRVMLNHVTYDISMYTGTMSVDANYPSMQFLLRVSTGVNVASECWLDNVIVTQNEPV